METLEAFESAIPFPIKNGQLPSRQNKTKQSLLHFAEALISKTQILTSNSFYSFTNVTMFWDIMKPPDGYEFLFDWKCISA